MYHANTRSVIDHNANTRSVIDTLTISTQPAPNDEAATAIVRGETAATPLEDG